MIARKLQSVSDTHSMVTTCEPRKAHSAFSRFRTAIVRWIKGPDMTFEQWQKLEQKYAPHSSHHAQIYFRQRGL